MESYEIDCKCGEGKMIRKRSNSERNKNKMYYICPKSKKMETKGKWDWGCNYFLWEENVRSSSSSSSSGSSGSSGKGTGGAGSSTPPSTPCHFDSSTPTPKHPAPSHSSTGTSPTPTTPCHFDSSTPTRLEEDLSAALALSQKANETLIGIVKDLVKKVSLKDEGQGSQHGTPN